MLYSDSLKSRFCELHVCRSPHCGWYNIINKNVLKYIVAADKYIQTIQNYNGTEVPRNKYKDEIEIQRRVRQDHSRAIYDQTLIRILANSQRINNNRFAYNTVIRTFELSQTQTKNSKFTIKSVKQNTWQ